MATSSQASLGEVMPEHVTNIVQVSHSPSPPTVLKTPECGQHLSQSKVSSPPRADSTCLPNEVVWLQGEMNVALEWLLMTKATLKSCQRELARNASIAMCQNETQATEAIKEAKV